MSEDHMPWEPMLEERRCQSKCYGVGPELFVCEVHHLSPSSRTIPEMRVSVNG